MSTIEDLKSKTTIAKIAMMTINKEAKEINSPYSLDWIKYENRNENYILKYARKDNLNRFNFTIPNPFSNECYCLCLCDDDKKLYIFKLENIDNKIIIHKDKNNDAEFKLKNSGETIEANYLVDLKDFENWLTHQRGDKLATKERIKNFGEQDDKQKESAQFESKEEFLKWYIKEPKECCYCGIKEEYLILYFNKNNNPQYYKDKVNKARQRGKDLEVERIETLNPKNVYSKENCALACYICNNAKSDFLSPKSFKPIAKGINEFWNQILLDNNKEKITFKENDKIWDKQ